MAALDNIIQLRDRISQTAATPFNAFAKGTQLGIQHGQLDVQRQNVEIAKERNAIDREGLEINKTNALTAQQNAKTAYEKLPYEMAESYSKTQKNLSEVRDAEVKRQAESVKNFIRAGDWKSLQGWASVNGSDISGKTDPDTGMMYYEISNKETGFKTTVYPDDFKEVANAIQERRKLQQEKGEIKETVILRNKKDNTLYSGVVDKKGNYLLIDADGQPTIPASGKEFVEDKTQTIVNKQQQNISEFYDKLTKPFLEQTQHVEQTINSMDQMIGMLNRGEVRLGAFRESLRGTGDVLYALGVPLPRSLFDDPAALHQYIKQGGQLTMDLLEKMGHNPSTTDLEFIKNQLMTLKGDEQAQLAFLKFVRETNEHLKRAKNIYTSAGLAQDVEELRGAGAEASLWKGAPIVGTHKESGKTLYFSEFYDAYKEKYPDLEFDAIVKKFNKVTGRK